MLLIKKICILVLVLFSANSYSYSCSPFSGLTLLETENMVQFKTLSSKNIVISKNEFSQIPIFHEEYGFEYESCREALIEWIVIDKGTNKKYRVISTYEDRCDGGNIYGNVYSYEEKRWVDRIKDGDISCI